jgi:type II secretion system protein N
MRPGLARGAALTFAWVTLFGVAVYSFFPTGRINALIGRALSSRGLSLAPAAHKTFLPGLAWDNLLLSSGQGPLIRLDRLAIRPDLIQLLTGRLVVGSTASLGAGYLKCDYRLSGRPAVKLSADRLNLKEMPFFKTILGARAGGSLWSEGIVTRDPKGWNGELKLEIRQLEFFGVRIGSFALPDADNLHSQGLVTFLEGKARLESLTLQGEGVYMRLSGELPQGVTEPVNLLLEIMPKPEYLEKQKLVFLLLAKFMASPGVYRVPITGTILKPEIL